MSKENHSNVTSKKIFFWIPITICIMFFLTASSPFLKYIDVDSAVFNTIGRGMAVGKVPYRDMFDHKGWYIYFFNCLGVLISPDNTVGLFIIECLFMLANVYLVYKTAMMVHGDLLKTNITVSLVLFFICNYITFQHGNLVETYGVTFQLISIFFIVKYYLNSKIEHPPVYMLIHGICVAVILGLRANLVAMWGPVAILILLRLFVKRKYRNAWKNILYGILGLLLGLSPMIIYGAVTHSLEDMFRQSILFNLAYADGEKMQVFAILTSLKTAWVIYLTVISLCLIIFSRFTLDFKILYTASLLVSMYSVTLSGRNYGHYYEYLIPFLLPLICVVSRVLSGFFSRRIQYAGIILVAFMTIMVNYPSKLHSYTYSHTRRYTEAVNEFTTLYNEKYSNIKTVLAVNNNAVIYNSFGVIPQDKYFYLPSISYSKFPEPVDSQAESILSCRNDIIIVKYKNYKKKQIFQTDKYDDQVKECLNQNYKLAAEKNHMEMYIKKE